MTKKTDKIENELVLNHDAMEFKKNHRAYPHPGFRTKGESRTQQHFKDECDINTIVRKYRTQGVVPVGTSKEELFGDFTNVPDLQEAMGIAARANQQFAALPSHMRERFNNDPLEFIDFVNDPKNQDAMADLGMMTDDAKKRVLGERAARKEAEFKASVDAEIERREKTKK